MGIKKPSEWSFATITALRQRFLSLSSLSDFAYYTAYISQSGTATPTAIVLKDTITGLTWSRQSAGVYLLTKINAFTENKVVPVEEIYYDESGNKYVLERVDINTMRLTTYVYTDIETPADDILTNQYIHIEIY